MSLHLELTGNEARLIFFALENKKSDLAEAVRKKLIEASNTNFLKAHRRAVGHQNGKTGDRDRPEEG